MFSILGSVCVGDKTSCGGPVIISSPFSEVNGRTIACVSEGSTGRKTVSS